MKCSNCQNEITPGATFCRYCGMRTDASTVQTTNINTGAVWDKPAESSSGSKPVVLIVLVSVLAVLLTVAVVAICFLMPRNSEKMSESQVVTEQYVEESDETPNETPVINHASDPGYYYFFASDTRYITESDLWGLDKEEVAMIRNEIYARHGYIFKTEPYKSYFESRDWYVPNPYFTESYFNEIEKANKEFLVQYEKDRGWR